MFIVAAIIVVIVLSPLLYHSMRLTREYERGIVFRLGRLVGSKGPGLILLVPVVDRMVKIDLRVVTRDIPRQEMMTRDNVSVTVDAVMYFRVVNPQDAVVKVADFYNATYLLAQTTLRSVLGQHELDELLSQRDRINQQLQHVIDEGSEPWGIKVELVEVRDVILPETMQRAMAKQAEIERERRAKVINAEGEYQAAEKLVMAAERMAEQPGALQLRYLQALTEVAGEHNSTTIFPIPIDLVTPFVRARLNEASQTPKALDAETDDHEVLRQAVRLLQKAGQNGFGVEPQAPAAVSG
jgi:regulator of protease activity HflC (stomatin/prohibitin superfamily)